MDKKITYHEQTSRENTLKLRSVLQTLPDFTKDFFRAIEPNTSAKTRISYVYDIRLFFQFLQINNPCICHCGTYRVQRRKESIPVACGCL